MPNSSQAKGLGEIECGHIVAGYNSDAEYPNKNLSSAFSYLKDRMSVVEMGAAIGRRLEGCNFSCPRKRFQPGILDAHR
jgi:hypothetical protein